MRFNQIICVLAGSILATSGGYAGATDTSPTKAIPVIRQVSSQNVETAIRPMTDEELMSAWGGAAYP